MWWWYDTGSRWSRWNEGIKLLTCDDVTHSVVVGCKGHPFYEILETWMSPSLHVFKKNIWISRPCIKEQTEQQQQTYTIRTQLTFYLATTPSLDSVFSCFVRWFLKESHFLSFFLCRPQEKSFMHAKINVT